MKRGETVAYGSGEIYRKRTRPLFDRDEYFVILADDRDADTVFASEFSAKAHIDAIDERERRRIALQAKQPVPVLQAGFPLTYRGYMIEVLSEDEDGRQCFRVSGMGDEFQSLGDALQRINWAKNSLESLENIPLSDSRGWKRNSEK